MNIKKIKIIVVINLNCDDVSVYAPYTAGLGWDNTSDGLTILLPDNNEEGEDLLMLVMPVMLNN